MRWMYHSLSTYAYVYIYAYLRSADDGLPRNIALSDDLFLSQKDLLRGQIHAQVPSRDHDAIGHLDRIDAMRETIDHVCP